MNEHHLADKTSLLLFIYSVNLIRTQDGRSLEAGREGRHPGPGSWLKGAEVIASLPTALLLGPMVDPPGQLASPHSSSSPPATPFVLQEIDSIFLLSLERT